MKRKNLKRKHFWTQEEEWILLKMLEEEKTTKEISTALGRSESSIRSKRWRFFEQ
jgi:DNA-binding NarL/FixJ family response regulator